MVGLSSWVVKRVSNPFLSVGNHRGLHWKRKKIHPTIIVCFSLQEKLHIFCKRTNCSKLHRAKNQFQRKFFGPETVGWFGGSWLLGDFILSRSVFIAAHKTVTREDNPLIGHKKEHKNFKAAILHEWRKERVVVLWHFWQSAHIKVNQGRWSAFLLIKDKRVYGVFQ